MSDSCFLPYAMRNGAVRAERQALTVAGSSPAKPLRQPRIRCVAFARIRRCGRDDRRARAVPAVPKTVRARVSRADVEAVCVRLVLFAREARAGRNRRHECREIVFREDVAHRMRVVRLRRLRSRRRMRHERIPVCVERGEAGDRDAEHAERGPPQDAPRRYGELPTVLRTLRVSRRRRTREYGACSRGSSYAGT